MQAKSKSQTALVASSALGLLITLVGDSSRYFPADAQMWDWELAFLFYPISTFHLTKSPVNTTLFEDQWSHCWRHHQQKKITSFKYTIHSKGIKLFPSYSGRSNAIITLKTKQEKLLEMDVCGTKTYHTFSVSLIFWPSCVWRLSFYRNQTTLTS